MKLAVPQSWSGCFGDQINPLGIGQSLLRCPACSIVTKPTELTEKNTSAEVIRNIHDTLRDLTLQPRSR